MTLTIFRLHLSKLLFLPLFITFKKGFDDFCVPVKNTNVTIFSSVTVHYIQKIHFDEYFEGFFYTYLSEVGILLKLSKSHYDGFSYTYICT